MRILTNHVGYEPGQPMRALVQGPPEDTVVSVAVCGEAEGAFDYLDEANASEVNNDWRWTEQWIPHGAWYMLAVAVGSGQQSGEDG